MSGPLSPPDLSHLQVIGPYGESVGRIVNYMVSDSAKLCPAVISAVRHDDNPDLLVLSSWVTSGGLAFLSKEVLLHKVPHYPRLREGHWSWREDEGGVCPKHHFAYCVPCKFPGWYEPIANPPESKVTTTYITGTVLSITEDGCVRVKLDTTPTDIVHFPIELIPEELRERGTPVTYQVTQDSNGNAREMFVPRAVELDPARIKTISDVLAGIRLRGDQSVDGVDLRDEPGKQEIALRAEITRLRSLPMIALCSDCAHHAYDGNVFCAHVDTREARPRALRTVSRGMPPPAWCPLRQVPR